ncbi:uncharacterized protein NPIL_150191 [Nephila pilipes]|uniref:Uncharacterized protein n=1 Tax=Nephila pilipes TaxID=299642 RepID=A0A8X6U1E2_NEPPI|nr:uncharacterized protein NPIL_150191 [Nephila pilipes]
MSSNNTFNPFSDTFNQSRIRKPPGGDTNDIFDLESRQNLQAQQKALNYDSKKQEKKCIENREKRNSENNEPILFAGITEQTRIRKPPGGHTNDIFGLEFRQKSQANIKQNNISDVSKIVEMNIDPENTNGPSSRFDSPMNQLNVDNLNKIPSYELNKENINVTLDKMEIFGKKFDYEINEDKLKNEDEEESKNSMKKYLRHNPITGEVSEMEVSARSKLVDCSNMMSNIERTPIPKKFDANRTSIRVRQPPGGASSNIF